MVDEPTNIIVGNIPMVLAANKKFYIGNSCYLDSTHDISRLKNTRDFNTCSSKCEDAKNCIEFDYTSDQICTLKSGTLIPYYSNANTICSIKVSCINDPNCLAKAVKPDSNTTTTTTAAVTTASTGTFTPSDFPTFTTTNSTPGISTSIVILIIFIVCFVVVAILGMLVLFYRKKSNAKPMISQDHEIQPLEDTKLLQPRIVQVDNDTESLAGTFDSTEDMEEVVSVHEPDTPIVEFPASPDISLGPFLK
ncbi:hypothetical protein HK103_001917 [Boothiomyces macroporosus]|uniref:Uncharacterized protein n=1 Tax=Boothiomyces macroporosus TaxID=261099 RepID=A0AAD5Y4X6_9FUNG|nr:hypothetical protein HK103_001917 [Boothiomyces macroporosus]